MSRRSRRKAKSQKKRALWPRVLLGLFLVLLLLSAVAFGWVRAYVKSDSFRKEMAQGIGRTFGGDVEIGEVVWQGLEVRSDRVQTVTERSPLGFEGQGISSELRLGGVLRGVWHIPQIRVRALELSYSGGEITPDPKKEREGGLMELLPDETEIDRVEVESLKFSFFGEQPVAFTGSRATALRTDTGSGYDVSFRGGKVESAIPMLADLELQTAELKQRPKAMHLQESEWTLLDGARLSAAATVDFDRGYWSLDGVLADALLEDLLTDNWKSRVRGRLNSVFQTSGSTREESSLVTTGTVDVSDAVLTALPLLDRLAAYVDSARLRNIVFDRADCHFRQGAGALQLSQIHLNSSGLLRLTGNVTVRGEHLKGALRLGIVPGLLARIPAAEEVIFKEPKDGLLWTTLYLDGPLSDIGKQLSRRLFDAARERMFQILPESGQIALKHTGVAVDEATAIIIEDIKMLGDDELSLLERMQRSVESGGKLIDIGGGAIEGLLKEIPPAELLPQIPGVNLLPGFGSPRVEEPAEEPAEE